MKSNLVLAITSLLSILLAICHLAHDIAVGIERGGLEMFNVVPVLVLWLYATLALGERRWAYLVVLVMSVLAAGVPLIHMTGTRGMLGRVTWSEGALFFAFTLIALGVTAILSLVLSARGLWSLRRDRTASAPASPVGGER